MAWPHISRPMIEELRTYARCGECGVTCVTQCGATGPSPDIRCVIYIRGSSLCSPPCIARVSENAVTARIESHFFFVLLLPGTVAGFVPLRIAGATRLEGGASLGFYRTPFPPLKNGATNKNAATKQRPKSTARLGAFNDSPAYSRR
jgi:hypothetical protein